MEKLAGAEARGDGVFALGGVVAEGLEAGVGVGFLRMTSLTCAKLCHRHPVWFIAKSNKPAAKAVSKTRREIFIGWQPLE
jgi:hypothetical protein